MYHGGRAVNDFGFVSDVVFETKQEYISRRTFAINCMISMAIGALVALMILHYLPL